MNKSRMQLTRTIATALLVLAGACVMFASRQGPSQSTPKSAAPTYTPAEIASGKEIYAKQCAVCHFPHSKAKKIGPGLAKIYPGGKFANGKKVDDVSMRLWIEGGGKDMPAFKSALKPEEIRDLIAYLRRL